MSRYNLMLEDVRLWASWYAAALERSRILESKGLFIGHREEVAKCRTRLEFHLARYVLFQKQILHD